MDRAEGLPDANRRPYDQWPTHRAATTTPLWGSHGASGYRSALMAAELLVDVRLGDRTAPVDVPGMEHQPGAPAGQDPHGPEVPASGDHPNADQQGIDDHIGDKMRSEVSPRLNAAPRRLPFVGDLIGLGGWINLNRHDTPPSAPQCALRSS